MTTKPTTEQMREEFEKAYAQMMHIQGSKYPFFSRNERGVYREPDVRHCWNVYQAAYTAGLRDGLERAAEVAARLATGVAIEIDGKQYLLGSMANSNEDAQRLTAIAIEATIRALKVKP